MINSERSFLRSAYGGAQRHCYIIIMRLFALKLLSAHQRRNDVARCPRWALTRPNILNGTLRLTAQALA